MKKHEIEVGRIYLAKVNNKIQTVQVDRITEPGEIWGTGTTYLVTNLATGRETRFRSAAKFRKEVTTAQQAEDLASPPQ